MRARFLPVTTALFATALLAVGCGEDSEGNKETEREANTQKVAFPDFAPEKTFTEVESELAEGPILAPAVSVLRKGENRFGFALFTIDKQQIDGVPVAVYTANTKGEQIAGPYRAHEESLAVKPQFQSQTSSSDPDAAKTVYVAKVPFKHTGKQSVFAVVEQDGEQQVTNPVPVTVGGKNLPPAAGEKAISVDTPTKDDVAGDIEQIDTRVPPSTMHDQSLKDVLGKEPVVITFATPLLCQSRVCGPVVDIVEQVKQKYGDDVAFIHQEIYRNNKVDDGLRPQVAKWRLASEPWTFVIAKDGTVVEAFEGAFSAAELEAAIKKAQAQG